MLYINFRLKPKELSGVGVAAKKLVSPALLLNVS
jgi:hypothetical protein